jgi:hypothetical protein
VRIEVEEAFASRLATGLAATVTDGSGEPLGHGRVVRVGARCERRTIGADPAAVRADGLVRAAWIEWDGAPASGTPLGERVEAVLELPPQPVSAMLPRGAVRVKDGAAVVEVRRGLLASERRVSLGASDAVSVEVFGVTPGETVVRAD